jgi:hypothetical protein
MSLIERYPRLLDQDALEGPGIVGRVVRLFNGYDAEKVAKNLNTHATITAGLEVGEIPASVIIQGRQEHAPASRRKATAPEKQADLIIATARNLRAQTYSGSVLIAATVDYPEFTATRTQRSELDSLGVRVLTEHHNVNDAQSLNRAFGAIDLQEGLTVVMPSGNRFATDQALRAAARHIGDNDGVAAYGPRVMDRNTTDSVGRELLMGDSAYYDQYAAVERNPSPEANGYMSPAGVALCSMSWSQYPLSEAYGRGGATRRWASVLQANDFEVVYDPALAVHDHSNPGLDTLHEEDRWLEPHAY